jgi:putative sensory transduction regulator
MDSAIFNSNLTSLRALLERERGFATVPHESYGTLFQFEFVPCCVPLPALAWVNPDSEGVFVRIIFPGAGRLSDEQVAALNRLNYDLPIGAFAADQVTGEIRFKSTVFVGNTALSTTLLQHLLASAADMVRVSYPSVIGVITGKPHAH